MILNPNSRIDRLVGRWRLFRGHCPRCNGDAPAVDECAVCARVLTTGLIRDDKHRLYPPSRTTKALWWYNWMRTKSIV